MTNEEWRGHRYYRFDPLQDIQPALLNSYDIKRYVDEGCLLEKSNFDGRHLKPASYELRFLGELHLWEPEDDGRLKRKILSVSENESVEIPKNSITYLWIKEKLLLPEYIAARFNLHIRHVHKGILLGTGPLVDPGFFGRILIPLHNLTDNDYKLKGGEGIIWVEFTKLNMDEFWLTENRETKQRNPFLKEFPKLKDIDDPDEYFKKSILGEGSVQSAFKGALDAATKSADEARNHTNSIKKALRNIGIIAIVAILLTFIGVLYQGFSFVGQIVDSAQEHNLRQIGFDRNRQSRIIDLYRDRMTTLEARMDLYGKEIEELKEQIELMEAREEPERSLAQ